MPVVLRHGLAAERAVAQDRAQRRHDAVPEAAELLRHDVARGHAGVHVRKAAYVLVVLDVPVALGQVAVRAAALDAAACLDVDGVVGQHVEQVHRASGAAQVDAGRELRAEDQDGAVATDARVGIEALHDRALLRRGQAAVQMHDEPRRQDRPQLLQHLKDELRAVGSLHVGVHHRLLFARAQHLEELGYHRRRLLQHLDVVNVGHHVHSALGDVARRHETRTAKGVAQLVVGLVERMLDEGLARLHDLLGVSGRRIPGGIERGVVEVHVRGHLVREVVDGGGRLGVPGLYHVRRVFA